MKRVLMVAYHFPPLAGSSGIQRTLRFVRHLPAFGWEPAVLTVDPRAYERTSSDLDGEVPRGLLVERAFGLDAARHLALAGRYPRFLSCPDRWMTWQYDAVRVGMRMIRKWKPDIIWSTYPIATAHRIGSALRHRSRLPWIADFRDPMAQEGYPADPHIWSEFKRIEETAARQARFSIFTTPGAARMYRERYPPAKERIVVVENGFDEESFAGIADAGAPREPLNPGSFTLLHSGIVYPSERDPTQLLAALRLLIDEGHPGANGLRIRFRAAEHDAVLARLARQYGVEHLIELCPPIPYRAALEEMTRADALLVLQASNCNEQIPAKLYEYLRAGRPLVALTDPSGDTARVMRDAGLDTVAPLDSSRDIATLLGRTAREPLPSPSRDYVGRASRRERARSLAEFLGRAGSED
ncbi:MAG: glycosyltransferase [Deltaproteobacteria bacterium]